MKLAAALLALALVPVLAGPAAGAGACPVPSPLGLLQDDAGSGRDAGHFPDDAVPVAAEGWFHGLLAVPLDVGLDDLHDWFALDLPDGPRTLTLDLQNVPNLVLGMGNTAPLIYYAEFWREGAASPITDFASWQPSEAVVLDGGRVLVHVYFNSLLIHPLCAPGPSTGAGLHLPWQAQSYGVLVDCEPDCWS